MATADTDEDTEYSRRDFVQTAAAATGAAATAGLAGCLGDDDDDDPAGTGEQDFLWWTMRGYIPSETEAIEDVAEGFEDWSDDEVNLTTEINTWDVVFQEWEAGIEGREMPNVSEMANEHAVDFGYRGAAQHNTELYEEYDDWYDATGIWGLFDDEKWGFPWFIEVRSLHLNMDLLGEAGWNDHPETWEELLQMGEDVQAETDANGITFAGARDFTTGQQVYGIMQQSGADLYNYDEDADEWEVTIDDADSLFAHLWYMSLREQWDLAPGGWGGVDGTDVEELFHDARSASALNSSDMARELIDPIDGVNEDLEDVAEATELALMPEGPAGNNDTFMGGSCVTAFDEEVTRHDAPDQMAFDFQEYMTLPESLNDVFQAAAPNFLPVRTGQEEMELFQDNPTELPDQWLDARLEQGRNSVRYGVTDAGRSAPHLGALEGATTAYSIPISALTGGDEEDPKTALTDLANTMREEIETYDYVDYDLPRTDPEDTDLSDANADVQPWIEGDGVPQIWNPYE